MAKYKITITTDNVILQDLDSVMEQISNNFSKGFVRGGAIRENENFGSYQFDTEEITEEEE